MGFGLVVSAVLRVRLLGFISFFFFAGCVYQHTYLGYSEGGGVFLVLSYISHHGL